MRISHTIVMSASMAGVLLFTQCGLTASEAKLPQAAQQEIDKYDAAAAKITGKVRRDLGKERDKLITALKREQDAATKRGDLEGGLAIKARIEIIASGRDAASAGDPSGEAQSAVEVVGDSRNVVNKIFADKVIANLGNISEADWDQLAGIVFVVDSHALTGMADTGIALVEGDKLLVVANPNDTWRCSDSSGEGAAMTWKGDVAHDPTGSVRWGSLFVQVGDRHLPPGMISGIGRVVLKCNDGTTGDNQGAIRVKVLRIVP